LVGVGGRAGQTEPRRGDEPLITITSKADCAIAAAHLVKFRGTSDGTPLSISASVRMVGNSVSPPPLCALARANLDPATVPQRIAA
jgi:hypothetical protein